MEMVSFHQREIDRLKAESLHVFVFCSTRVIYREVLLEAMLPSEVLQHKGNKNAASYFRQADLLLSLSAQASLS